jgi:hypothetical protein
MVVYNIGLCRSLSRAGRVGARSKGERRTSVWQHKSRSSRTARARIGQHSLQGAGTTRPRVSFFMNKFRKLGFIEYNGELQINSSLLSVVLRD